ncbi:hypothetical protein Tco_1581357 [Tanacetum coccineum]
MTEVEYVSAKKACQQALWMKQALINYGICLDDVPIISTKYFEANTQVHEESSSTSSIFVDTHEAPPVVTTSDEQASPISLIVADEFNQEDTADFDGNA